MVSSNNPNKTHRDSFYLALTNVPCNNLYDNYYIVLGYIDKETDKHFIFNSN